MNRHAPAHDRPFRAAAGQRPQRSDEVVSSQVEHLLGIG